MTSRTSFVITGPSHARPDAPGRRGDRLYGANPQALSRRLSQAGVAVAAIKWALKNESVDTAIVCMTSHDQLEENLRAMAEPYTERDEHLLTAQLLA